MKRVSKLKKHIVILLTLLLITGMVFPAAAVYANVSDINGHWAEKTIKVWSDKGLIRAYPDGTFKPDRHVSRAEFISMTNHAFHFMQEADHSFNDVEDDKWYTGEIRKAIHAGYIKGYSDGIMQPDSPVIRQEAAVILTRLLDLSPNESGAELLTDAESIPAWSKASIGSIISSDIMKGYPDGRFGPVVGLTRAEAVVTLEMARNRVTTFETAGTYGPAEGTKTICGHVFVKADGAILQNLIITGDLIITEEVGNGDVTLNNITVYGETYIRGGGKDSIHINGGVFRKVVVQNIEGQVRIVAMAVNGLTVVIGEDATGEAIILEGNFASVVLENVSVDIVTQGRTSIGKITVSGSSGSPVITLSERTTVSSMILESKADINGAGTVVRAEVKADGVSFERPPSEQTVAPGVKPPAITPPTTRQSGGNSDYSSSQPLVIPETYTLTVQANPVGGGSTADSTANNPYEEGTSVQVTTTSNAGFEFVSWTSGVVIVSTEAAFTYTMPAANTTLTANFLPAGYVPVASAEELNKVRYDAENTYGAGTVFEGTYRGGLDKKYIQVADIDLNTTPYNTGAGWTPFGTAWTIPFTGKYDGNGYVIDNLFINRPTTDGIGLFGYVGEAGQLIEIVLTNANVTGAEKVGILAGANEGYIDNCSSVGQVTGCVDTGGLVGISYNFDKTIDRHALIKNSHSSATVQNSDLYGGGLVGSNYGKVENCYATGAVTGSTFVSGGYAGGLAGQNLGMVTGSYATGNVNGDGAGGLVGENYKNVMASKYEAQILNSYATGIVFGEYSLGGLVGYSYEGSIDNCYATGNVSGKEAVAGLVGEMSNTNIDNCFVLNGTITRTSGDNTKFARAFCEYSGGNTVGVIYARNDMNFEGVNHVIDTAMGSGDGMALYPWITDNNTLRQVYGEEMFLFTHLLPPGETYTTTSVAGNITDAVSTYTDSCSLLMSDAKVVSASASAAAGEFSGWNYDAIAGKADAENLAIGDIILTKSLSGTLRTYEIAVIDVLSEIVYGSVPPTPIAAGTSNPGLTIILLNSYFTAGAEDTENWAISTGTTGLTVDSIALQGDDSKTNEVMINFAGSAAVGTISIQGLAAAVTRDRDTNIVETVVVPRMSGTVTIDGEPRFDEQLTANISGITYGSLMSSDVPTYQWHRAGVDIDGATASTYTLVEVDISETISVTVSADGTHATGSVTSGATAVVAKAEGPAAPEPPVLFNKTHNSVTLTTNEAHEFSRNDGETWQSDNEFTELSPNTEYTFRARIKGTTTQKVSQPSESLSVQTLQIVAQLAAGSKVEFDGREYFVLNPASGYLLSVHSINSAMGDLITWGSDNENPSNVKAFLDNWFDANIQRKNVVQDFGGHFDKIGLISTNDWNNRPAEVTNPDYIRIGRTWTSSKAGSTTYVWQIKSADGSMIQSHSSSSYGDVRHAIKILTDLAVDTINDKIVVMVP